MNERNSGKDLIVVHSSDLHVDDGFTMRTHEGESTKGLRAVLATAKAVKADLVLLVGDVFEHNRLAPDILQAVEDLVKGLDAKVVFLPGNHDPAVEDSVYHRGAFTDAPNVRVMGFTDEDVIAFPELDLEIWGRAHMSYGNMSPLKEPKTRNARWHLAIAHGHYVPLIEAIPVPSPAWLLDDAEIAATGADYVALGHWNQWAKVGDGTVPAYYSGSPEFAGTVNVIRLTQAGEVIVDREPVRWDDPS